MDRPPLRESGLRLWISTLGAALDDGSTGETRHEEDLPLCCRSEAAPLAGEPGEVFGCESCGAAWQIPEPVEPEFCAFTHRAFEEQEGAA